MKKLVITALIGATLLSCTKNDEPIEVWFNSSDKEVGLESEQQRKLSVLQARGYFTFISLQSLEEKVSSLRGTKLFSLSLANFFADQSVISPLTISEEIFWNFLVNLIVRTLFYRWKRYSGMLAYTPSFYW